jgi:hypothetical protein
MAGRKGKPAPSLMRFLPLAMLLALLIFVGAVVMVYFMSPATGAFHYPVAENESGCAPGTARACSVGICSGMSTCLGDGTWGGCDWQRVCIPGSRAPCIQDGCAYAFKTCNPCGSGYGDCAAPASPTNSTAG